MIFKYKWLKKNFLLVLSYVLLKTFCLKCLNFDEMIFFVKRDKNDFLKGLKDGENKITSITRSITPSSLPTHLDVEPKI